MQVYKSINLIQSDLCKEGIGKNSKNEMQGYKFRGIDAVYNALSPLMAKHGLCILPRVLRRECVERTTAKGGIVFYVTVEAEFDFISSEDGSKHTVKTYGEAMDSGDKATNKAMSAAYKYAAFQAFSIPTEGDNDADATTHEVVVQCIDEFQAANIASLMKETGTDNVKFFKWLSVKQVSEIPAKRYDEVVAALEKKRVQITTPENKGIVIPTLGDK